ncbi:RocC [Ureibacillus massiliensis 4400831 = CIP 108448 = CCUG 49529]|uniref:RocC n=1 Tax=Ureibacillus massiliensis 4400831 = CIP 108448 = CCUG 49529 TaxID=1211035 RepID=A0A0A3IZJ6_9BACL|nr:RocC [Ureibacillus massiliensis 4400831 = CIP 108448 = CCUG 49529]
MKRLTLLISTIIVLIIVVMFIPIFKVFSFTETRTNNPHMYYINVSKDNLFQIRFTHSIHLTDVLETYEITDSNRLKLVSMEYEDVNVGMPAHAEEDQTLTFEDGKYKLSYKDKTIDNFTLLIGNVDYDLFFQYKGEEYDLKKSLIRGSSYLFEVKNISLYDKLRGVMIADGK